MLWLHYSVNVVCWYTHVRLKIVSKDPIFYLLWYNVVRRSRHICKKSSFLPFYSFLVNFSQSDRGSDRVKLTVWQCPMGGWKIPLCSWHTFWMAPCYFIAILFYIERKWLLMRNLARILHSKSKKSVKFHYFKAIYKSTKMLNSWIYKNFN